MEPDDIIRILDELGQRLTPAGQYVFQLAVKQQIINGAFAAILAGLFILMFLIQIYFIIKRWRGFDFTDKLLNVEAAIALLIAITFTFSIAANNLLNPEYAAIKELLGQLTGAANG